MARIALPVILNYSDPKNKYARNMRDQVHEAYYQCTNCKRTYVSCVLQRFKPGQKVGP